jgi:threonine synthase
MGKMKGLKCRECGKVYPAEPLHVCEFCFGPLEVDYDYEAIAAAISRDRIVAGPKSLWRYIDLLPVEKEATVGLHGGFTPMIRPPASARHSASTTCISKTTR